MSSNSSIDLGAAMPQGADDFTRIRGVSQKIASRLCEAGILTFAKLAAMSPDEIVTRIGVSGVSPESIADRDWIGQALALASQPAPVALPDATGASGAGLSEVSYVIGFLVDEHKKVRRTKVLDVSSNEEDAWDEWEAERLIGYFARRPELRLPKAKSASPAAEPDRSAPLTEAPDERRLVPAAAASTSPAAKMGLAGVARFQTIEMAAVGNKVSGWRLGSGQRLNLRLTLDLSDVTAPDGEPINYIAIVQAKSLGDGQRQVVSEARGAIKLAKSVTLDLEGKSLPAGVYRLHAAVTFGPPGEASPSRQCLIAQREGGVFQVY